MAKHTSVAGSEHMVSLVDAAIQLGIAHQAAQRLLHVGILRGERRGLRGGRWVVTKASVQEAERLLGRATREGSLIQAPAVVTRQERGVKPPTREPTRQRKTHLSADSPTETQ